ncbi:MULTISPECIES: EamA family transporter RarD [Arthrobacter]|uniref:EamA family transporter RarD n=2 Tax=Arthrobacter TaxID=1663 RepID=A0ABU9KMF1_9MICC|nr:EamA family transporter RarD [Arthrobacter sp. YJM1]MDP5227995.1 EamA family transporter RarD [Arthrobacter sp. YJM1]
MLYGVGAYGLWGLLPLYFMLLLPAGAVEIVANRVLWSLIFCAILMTATRSWGEFLAALRRPRTLGVLAIAAALIGVNWLTYTYGVTSGQAVEASLGYYINPLVSVLLGVLVLKERLRPVQWVAVGIGAVAVVVLTVAYGKLPWIALVLAFSFGFYGLMKKKVGAGVNAVTSLSVETLVLAPFAAVTVVALTMNQAATLTGYGSAHFWLMAASGIITAVPLVFFGASASRLPLTTIGMLQYFAPTLQLLVATLVLGEHMGPERWVGFGLVWAALLVLTADIVWTTVKVRRN